jgi:enediyne biosynthesis protein E4
MRAFLFITAVLFSAVQSYAVLDTLRHYNTTIGAKGYSYPSATYPKLYARFEPKAPGNITKVVVTLNGPTGSCKLRILGHAGGGQLPQTQVDLVTPITVTKSLSGIRKMVVTLPSPLFMDNNEFFLKFETFTANVTLVTDTITHINCLSQWGGDMYYQYLENGAGTPFIGNSAFAVDVIMDYTAGITSPQLYQNISTASGIGTGLSNASIAWGDIDKDGFLDLLASGKLFKNNQNNTFTDITASAGINTPFFRNNFIDMNNDGKDDILFLSSTAADNCIYINNGNSTFTKTPLTFTTPAFDWISTISIADVNNDKYPDLFVGQLKDAGGNGLPNYFFLNNMANGFTNATTTFYPTVKLSETRGSQFVDFDNDGDLDLYVSLYRNAQDEFWQNNGNGTFTDICVAKGIDRNTNGTSNHGTGCDWADYDNDGDMDLLLPQLCHGTNLAGGYSTTTLYKNSGAPNYTFTKAASTGIQYEETHAGSHWGDVNSDGLADVFTSAFYTCRYSDLYLQQANNTFALKSWDYGIHNVSGETDGTLVDFNNDGKLDLACGDNTYFLRLFKNNATSTNNYISINLVSTSGNAFAIGAKVVMQAGGKTYTQYQMPNHGALMNKSNRLFFGLGASAVIDKITISWPNGTVNYEEFTTGLTANSVITLTEGAGTSTTAMDEPISPALQYVSVYPNPFTDEVFFEYELTESSAVTVEVYSLMGTKVASVISEVQSAGSHKISWDGNSLSAGVYSYRVSTGSGMQNGLVTLVR